MEIHAQQLRLKDGRTLAWAEYGDPLGAPVFYFHAAGSCLLEGACFHEDAKAQGLRLIAPSRPGAWQSTPKPQMQPLEYASDCVELADAIGVRRFVTTGNSNGGLFTMAVAHALPQRVTGAAPVNCTSPLADPAVRAIAPLSLKLMMGLAKFTARWSEQGMRSALKSGGVAKSLPADAEPEIVQRFLDNVARVSNESALLEIGVASRHWGFDHRAVLCPVRIVYGENDTSRYLGDTWARELRDGKHVTTPGGHHPISPAARRILAQTWRSLTP